MNRINRNLRWVKRQLDLAGPSDYVEEEILDAMTQVEREILERTGCVKQSDTVVFDAVGSHAQGIYAFPAGMGRLVYAECPSSWFYSLTLTENVKTYDEIKKANVLGTQPLVCLIRNSTLTFWPVPVSGESIILYSFRAPKADDSEAQVEGTGDPILPSSWDVVLRLKALALLDPGGNWVDRAEVEYARTAHRQIQESGVPLQVDHSSRKLGF